MQVTRHVQHVINVIFPRPICDGFGEKQAVGKEDAGAATGPEDTDYFPTDRDGAGEVVDGQGCREGGREEGRNRE
jgi:hypothetical protein